MQNCTKKSFRAFLLATALLSSGSWASAGIIRHVLKPAAKDTIAVGKYTGKKTVQVSKKAAHVTKAVVY